ncbi:putative integral membrane protein (TIGR00698 family) [Rhizomicrobium palustre]|uniref:Putative integral membrane protein (TIGR00698 family) n=1 Tax=Rhizomicrobium palustre TaxID=189966 RepID=A0A846N323_9PROT|nr:YeiH family protein [Rhizomicrobium palustre]NIK89622.1 putative integral membrane protein (TIGR00698 family) [Rhizomicrobium palustre]
MRPAAIDAPAPFLGHFFKYIPGLGVAGAVVALAYGLRNVPGFSVLSPMILAILLGMMFHNLVGTPARAKPGVKFAMRHILRFAVALLGLQLTTQQLAEVGLTGVAIIAATLGSTFILTKWLGKMLGVEQRLAELIAAGTSICGASAVVAVNTVTEAHDEDVAYAVACVTIFGTVAMFVYPLLPSLLHLGPQGFGLWAGASIHEVAQVVAASFQDGKAAGEFGTIAKLARVGMLAPVVMVLAMLAARRSSSHKASTVSLPGFVTGFVFLVLFNSAVPFPASWHHGIAVLTTILLSIALAALGLETDIRKLAEKGFHPMLLGAVSSLFIACFSLFLVETFAG